MKPISRFKSGSMIATPITLKMVPEHRDLEREIVIGGADHTARTSTRPVAE
ncbi:MAG: hypothetical protein IPF96_20710 [Rhodobacter sp.]|nr:hypothetical protein [Rhodobacter sp.]